MSAMLLRVLGAATAAYSAAIMVRPSWLAKPCGLARADGTVPAPTGLLIRSIGARDTALGMAMLLAPDLRALRAVTACRVVADLSDAALFGTALTGTARRAKAVGVAVTWGGLCAAAAARASRTAPVEGQSGRPRSWCTGAVGMRRRPSLAGRL
ncbi:hypothetical protein ACFC4G_45375 [Streptomyces sp. NPDC056002]|uniref:hypothetical protein n=1 Tax=Streptomyces sp. NPDC056002 TaxID=3345675 RepID=UPI0035D67542